MLVLFDIDGTLLHGTTQPVGQALGVALKEVHGVDTSAVRTQIATAGRTDGEIARAILVDAGVGAERIDALAGRVRESSRRWSARLLPADLSSAVLPGVRELLGWLAEHNDVTTALLTGNDEPIAWLKLERAGIGDTPRDTACARADGLRCVAVASGPFTADALAGADAVARDAFELRPILSDLGVGALRDLGGGP